MANFKEKSKPVSNTFWPRPRAKGSVIPEMTDPPIADLLHMHTYGRPAGSKCEEAFNAVYLDNIEGMTIDLLGNRILRIGTSPVLWSSHTDTVHQKAGRTNLTYGDGMLYLAEKEKASCLGADCSAGVWLMREMIKRGVEGLYIFHAAEEVGGKGSSHISTNNKAILEGIKWAIAFDRKGVDSVITHQFGRCCSDEFADALCAKLGMGYVKDDGGTFTDTANYTSLIPECTNISVGYYYAHTSNETLDVSHLADLLEVLCQMDVSDLPSVRDMIKSESRWAGYDGYYGSYQKEIEDVWKPAKKAWTNEDHSAELEQLVMDHPDVAAIILGDYGITPEVFDDYLVSYGVKK